MADSEVQPPSHPEVNAIPPKSASRKKHPKPPIDPPPGPQVPPSLADEGKTTCRPDQTPIWKIVLEGSAIIVGVFAVAIYGSQLWVMSGQLDQMTKQYPELKKSADAAKVSADAAKNMLEMEKRTAENRDEASCTPAGDIAVGDEVYHVFINNGGKVTARHLVGHIEISLNKLPSNNRIRLLSEFDTGPTELAAQTSFDKFVNLGLSPRDWDELINTRETLVETSNIQYDNGFDRIVTVPRCYVVVWVPSPTDPNNRAHGSGLDCDRLPLQLANIAKEKARH